MGNSRKCAFTNNVFFGKILHFFFNRFGKYVRQVSEGAEVLASSRFPAGQPKERVNSRRRKNNNLRRQWEAENPDSDYLNQINRRHDKKSEATIAEYETLAHHAATRLQKMFPAWTVTAEAASGSPAWEVLSKADNFQPDLIVAGSQGRSALGRFFLGSISQRILTEAYCSVEVVRTQQ